MAKIESALEKHLPSRLAMYKPIINALIQMGTKADPALVAKVQGLITELQNTLEAELSTS
jgi:flagellin-specific chaperone FliS